MTCIRPVSAASRIFSRTTTLAFAAFCFATGAAAQTSTQPPVVTPGFTLTVFAQGNGTGSLRSAPDSIAVLDGHIWVGYANNGAPDGSKNAMSEIVEYPRDGGTALRSITLQGHNDGLKVNPYTREIWAMQNEDANPNLVTINPATGATTTYTFDKTPHGGGYDDMVFKAVIRGRRLTLVNEKNI